MQQQTTRSPSKRGRPRLIDRPFTSEDLAQVVRTSKIVAEVFKVQPEEMFVRGYDTRELLDAKCVLAWVMLDRLKIGKQATGKILCKSPKTLRVAQRSFERVCRERPQQVKRIQELIETQRQVAA